MFFLETSKASVCLVGFVWCGSKSPHTLSHLDESGRKWQFAQLIQQEQHLCFIRYVGELIPTGPLVLRECVSGECAGHHLKHLAMQQSLNTIPYFHGVVMLSVNTKRKNWDFLRKYPGSRAGSEHQTGLCSKTCGMCTSSNFMELLKLLVNFLLKDLYVLCHTGLKFITQHSVWRSPLTFNKQSCSIQRTYSIIPLKLPFYSTIK